MKNSGFTLVELMVVIGIIGIFSSFLIATLNPFEQFKKANDTSRKNDLSQMQRAFEAYYQDFQRYPESANYKIVYNSTTLEWGNAFAPYMTTLPKDKGSGKTYIYVVSASGQAYYLYASLDRGGKDSAACTPDGSACPNVPMGVTCGSGVCNYGVSSSNASP